MVEPHEGRRHLCRQLGLNAVAPEDAPGNHDVAVHTSAAAAGLETALRIAGDDGSVIELSWYGTRSPEVPLGPTSMRAG